MAQKDAVINIRVNTPKTLGQLEDELSGINSQLKQLDVNSDAFKSLQKDAQKLDGEIKDLNKSLEGLSFEDKAGAIGDAAAGITGAFSLATQAAGLFGEDAAEGFGKAEAQALQFVQAMNGIEGVTKLFKGETIKMFQSLTSGFGNAVKSVRLFGLSSAASLALATAGITVLITAVIALVANFDKVTAFFNDLADSLPFLDSIRNGFNAILDVVTKLDNIWDGIIGAIKTIGDDSKTISEGFNEAYEASLKMEESADNLKKIREETIPQLEDELKVAESIKDNADEVYKIKKQILTTEIDALKLMENLSKEDAKQLKDLEISLKVLENQEKTRQEALKIEQQKTKEADAQRKLDEEKAKIAEQVRKRALEDEAIKIKENLKAGDDTTANLERQQALLETILYTLEELNNPLTDIQRAEFEITELYLKRAALEDKLNTLSEKQADTIEDFQRIQNEIAQTQNEILEIDIKRTEQEVKLAALVRAETANKIKAVAELAKKEGDAEFKKGVNELKINQILDVRGKVLGAVVRKQKEETKQLLATADASEILNYKLEQAFVSIQLLGDAANVAFDAAFTSLNNQLIELDAKLAKVRKEQEEFNENEIDYQALLKDANGEKFAEIEAGMLAQQTLQDDLHKQEVDLQNAIIEAENKSAELAKKQAVVNSAIQTALAVVQALPNIPLSVAVGVIGAAQTAIIAAKKVPKQELIGYSEGGFTEAGGKYDVAGVVHKGEYVVPQEVLATQQGLAMAQLLESMRANVKGFADGGFTSNVPQVSTGIQTVSTLNSQPIYTVITEVRDGLRNVEVIQNRSSI